MSETETGFMNKHIRATPNPRKTECNGVGTAWTEHSTRLPKDDAAESFGVDLRSRRELCSGL